MSDLERMVERLVAERDAAAEQAILAGERVTEIEQELQAFTPRGFAYYGMVRVEEGGPKGWRYEYSDGMVRGSGACDSAEDGVSKALNEVEHNLRRNLENEWRRENDGRTT